MSVYSPARGDFGIEHDNYAELNLANLQFKSRDEDSTEDNIEHGTCHLGFTFALSWYIIRISSGCHRAEKLCVGGVY